MSIWAHYNVMKKRRFDDVVGKSGSDNDASWSKYNE